MVHARASTTAEFLDEENELDEEELAALRVVIARGRAASEEECISAEEALVELDAIMSGP